MNQATGSKSEPSSASGTSSPPLKKRCLAMASNSQFLDTSQDVDKKLAHEPDSSTLSQGNSQGAGENSDPKSDPPTPSPGSSHDVPQDVENDPDSDDLPDPPAQPFPAGLLRFIRPDNFLIRLVEEYNVHINNPRDANYIRELIFWLVDMDKYRDITYLYPRARG